MSKCFAVLGSFLKVACVILLVSYSQSTADASLWPMESIEQSFQAAEMVVLLRVDESQTVDVEGDVCGFRYTATVLTSFKGGKDLENRQIQFGRFKGLDEEKTYLAFLERHDDPEVEYRKIRDANKLPDIEDEAEKKKAMTLVACKGMVPGLAFNDRFTWPVALNYVIITGLTPANFPDNVRVYPTDSAQLWVQKQDLFSYLRGLNSQKN